MNKNFKFFLSVWAILVAIFNIVAFVTPAEAEGMNKFGGAFWSGYVFIMLAFIGQLMCGYFALKDEDIKKLFYNISVLKISWSGLILTMIFGTLCMAVPNLPNWVGIVICVIILGLTEISVLKATLAGDMVYEIDGKIKTQTFFIKELTADAEGLVAKAKNEAVKTECKKVYEAIRYSDPMSNAALNGIENEIEVQFKHLAKAVEADNAGSVREISERVFALVGDRNRKCKVLK